jgi:regulator of protease activity HflC (stomatin/prohibitin superfamily)
MENTQEPKHEIRRYAPFHGGGTVLVMLLALAWIIYMPLIGYGVRADGSHVYLIGDIYDFACPVALLVLMLSWSGFTQINPNESVVLTFFGTRKGSALDSGFFWINPFMTGARVSLKAKTLTTASVKMTDSDGRPITVGAVLNYRVVNPESYIFNADEPEAIVANAMEVVLRESVSVYPFDLSDAEMKEKANKICLRQNSEQIADEMREKIQKKLNIIGIRVLDVRLSNIAYAQEIAGLMLLRQQASAMVSARTAILDASVPLVRQVIRQLGEENDHGPRVTFTESQKATLATNLLTVMISEKAATPTLSVND